MKLIDTPLTELLAAFSAPDPTPGGGSASALASALGASLLMMVGRLPKTRTGAADERSALDASVQSLSSIRDSLTEAIDADTAAYDRVVAAYKRPKHPTDDQEARKAAIQDALRGATDVPVQVMRLSAAALRESDVVAAHGHAGAASDVGVGVALLRAGLRGARLNVEINLDAIRDEAYAARVRAEIEQLAPGGSS
jgi:methenyltetrahydrofolate cyclohydrolase